jgi:hypothetical protein
MLLQPHAPGSSYLYALALVPVGLLADKVSRQGFKGAQVKMEKVLMLGQHNAPAATCMRLHWCLLVCWQIR